MATITLFTSALILPGYDQGIRTATYWTEADMWDDLWTFCRSLAGLEDDDSDDPGETDYIGFDWHSRSKQETVEAFLNHDGTDPRISLAWNEHWLLSPVAVVTVEGGCVQGVQCLPGQAVRVIVVDFDTDGAPPAETVEIEGGRAFVEEYACDPGAIRKHWPLLGATETKG